MGPEWQQLAGCQPEPFCCFGSNLGGEGAGAGDQKQATQNAACRGSLGAGQQGCRKAGRTGLLGVWEAQGARWHRLNLEATVSGHFHFFATKDGCPPELKKPEPNHPPFLENGYFCYNDGTFASRLAAGLTPFALPIT